MLLQPTQPPHLMNNLSRLVPLCCLAVHLEAPNLQRCSACIDEEVSAAPCHEWLCRPISNQSTQSNCAQTVAASLCPLPALLGRLASLECFGFRLSSACVRAFPIWQQRLRRLAFWKDQLRCQESAVYMR